MYAFARRPADNDRLDPTGLRLPKGRTLAGHTKRAVGKECLGGRIGNKVNVGVARFAVNIADRAGERLALEIGRDAGGGEHVLRRLAPNDRAAPKSRGDLGVELPPEMVPAIQKHIIRRAADYSKPVITATQMLESMIENPRPTRAEVSDVANAVYDGTDAVMLSGESAVGKYPVEAVSMMARIVSEAERDMKEGDRREAHERQAHLSIAETICEATAHAADDLDLRGVALFTESGQTARQLSKYHPSAPIFALSPVEITINRLNLLWGTTPILCPKVNSTEAMVDTAESLLEQNGYVRSREVIAIVAGTRTKSGSTNFMRLHVIGEHSLEGARFFAPKEDENVPAPPPEAPAPAAKQKRPVAKSVKSAQRRK